MPLPAVLLLADVYPLRRLGLEHVVAMRAFLTNFERDYAPMNEVYRSYFPADRLPARTCVGVNGLARNALVEIDCIARRP